MGDRRKQVVLVSAALLGAMAVLLLLVGLGGTAVVILLTRIPVAPVSSPKPDLPTGAVTVAGKHLVLHVLPIERANATLLATLGDAALERYAQALGVTAPSGPIDVYLLDTEQDFDRACALYGSTIHNGAFSHDGRVFIRFVPRPGETVVDGDSRMAHILAHELCHALLQRLFPNYDCQPAWLEEGLADAWSERVFSETDALTADRSPSSGTMLLTLRQAVQEGEALSVAQILAQKRDSYACNTDDFTQSYLCYCRSFALVRMLDDPAPANAARRARFRAFLHEANTMEGDDIAGQINARFQEQFGGMHLAELQAELSQRLATEKVFPWRAQGSDVHRLHDGALMVEPMPNACTTALEDGRTLAASAHLHTRIEVANVGTPRAELLFGGIARDDYYVLLYGPNFITLSRYRQKTYETLASQWLDGNRFTPGPHTLDVTLRPQQVEASLDGRPIGNFAFTIGAFPSGQWGIGVVDGRITFHDLKAEDIRP